jgi:hypothetical protein
MVPQMRQIHRGEAELRKSLETLSKTVQGRADRQLTQREAMQLRELSDRQERLAADLHLAIVLMQSQGLDTPFREVNSQVLSDITTVKRRLDRGAIDSITLTIARDVEEMLKELIDAYLMLGKLKESDTPVARPLRDAFPTVLPSLAAMRAMLVDTGGER